MKLLPVFLLLLCIAGGASAQTIGVFADSAGTDCNLEFRELGVPVVVYVVATIDNQAADGVTRAVFRIEGLPVGWTAEVTAGADVPVTIGDVFAEGAIAAFDHCVTGHVVLMEIEITPESVVESDSLSVLTNLDSPRGCGFEGGDCGPCARFCGCGDLFIPCYCARGVTSTINGNACEVAISAVTWARLKRLYR